MRMENLGHFEAYLLRHSCRVDQKGSKYLNTSGLSVFLLQNFSKSYVSCYRSHAVGEDPLRFSVNAMKGEDLLQVYKTE